MLVAMSYTVNAGKCRIKKTKHNMTSAVKSVVISRCEHKVANMQYFEAEKRLIHGPEIAD